MSLPQGVRELLLTDLPPGTAVTLTDPDDAGQGDELVAYVPALSLLPADRGISQALRDVSFAGLTRGRWRVRYWNPRHEDVPQGFEYEVGEDGRLPLRAASRRSAVPSMEDWVVVVSPLG